MRLLTLIAISVLTAAVSAQTSGRHFHRVTRTPVTAPAAEAAPQQAAEASATTAKQVAPLRKLRSGRAWPSHHFGRLPANQPEPEVGPVDAAARRAPTRTRGFWRILR